MSTHPNALLILSLTPDGLSRKTMKSILEEFNVEDDDQIKIGENEYSHKIMESDYDEDSQVAGKEGDLVFYDMVTYGYGELIEWEKLEQYKNDLSAWAKLVCENHNCSFKIYVSANYW